MAYWAAHGNAYHHTEVRVEVANYGDWYGRVTRTASAALHEVYGPKKEEALSADESNEDDEGGHLPGPSGMSNGKPALNGTRHAGPATFPQAHASANETGLYVCRDCQKAFTRSDSLAQHGTQPHAFACHMCAFKTTTAKLLKKHQFEHRTDLRPCNKCDFKGLTDKALRRHKRKEHGTDAPAPSLEKATKMGEGGIRSLSKKQLAALAETVIVEPTNNGTLRTNVFGRPIPSSGTLATDDQAADQNRVPEGSGNESTASTSPQKQFERKHAKKKRQLRSDLMCPHCRRTYARPRDLEKHVKRAIHCWCGYFAVNQNAWERHVQQRHTGGAQQQQPAPPHAGPVAVKLERQAAHDVKGHFGGAQLQTPPWADPVDVTQEPQASGSAPGVWWF